MDNTTVDPFFVLENDCLRDTVIIYKLYLYFYSNRFPTSTSKDNIIIFTCLVIRCSVLSTINIIL